MTNFDEYKTLPSEHAPWDEMLKSSWKDISGSDRMNAFIFSVIWNIQRDELKKLDKELRKQQPKIMNIC